MTFCALWSVLLLVDLAGWRTARKFDVAVRLREDLGLID